MKRAVMSMFLLAVFPVASWAGGTHFIIEPYTGLTFNLGYSAENLLGLESGALLGVGGKFKGFPPRFYLYFRAGQAFFGDDEVLVKDRDAICEVRRSVVPVMGGLRIVIPTWSYLRLNLDIGGGAVFTDVHFREPGYSLGYAKTLSAVELGAGLNWRLFRWLSLGAMFNYTFLAEDERGDLASVILGAADNGARPGWARLVATLGIHF